MIDYQRCKHPDVAWKNFYYTIHIYHRSLLQQQQKKHLKTKWSIFGTHGGLSKKKTTNWCPTVQDIRNIQACLVFLACETRIFILWYFAVNGIFSSANTSVKYTYKYRASPVRMFPRFLYCRNQKYTHTIISHGDPVNSKPSLSA